MSDNVEKRTTFRRVRSELAESSSDDIVPVVSDTDEEVEFFRLGRSSLDILRCNRVEKCAMEALTLLFERGVDGAVDVVTVDSDTLESDGVGGTD